MSVSANAIKVRQPYIKAVNKVAPNTNSWMQGVIDLMSCSRLNPTTHTCVLVHSSPLAISAASETLQAA
jgi:hypothetical protein